MILDDDDDDDEDLFTPIAVDWRAMGDDSLGSTSSRSRNTTTSSPQFIGNNSGALNGVGGDSSSSEREVMSPPPSFDPNPDFADALLAETMNSLSIEDREKTLHDIHGVADVIEETDSLLLDSLQRLQEEIDSIPNTDLSKQAYLQAFNQNSNYVASKSFRLKFIRADNFDIIKASQRLLKFFEHKLELFGYDKLTKDITQNDLSESPDDIQCLQSGFLQLLPGRDRAGRSICFTSPRGNHIGSTMNKLRVVYYIHMLALDDVETQKKGFVGIVYNVGSRHDADRDSVWKTCQLHAALPMKFASIHYLFDDPSKRFIFALASTVLEASIKVRLRPHFGTHVECIYTLLTFGIRGELVPVNNSTYEFDNTQHDAFLERQREKENVMLLRHNSNSADNSNAQVIDGATSSNEDDSNPTAIVIVPATQDILLGRGKSLQNHVGNVRFRHVIEIHADQYEKADKFAKTLLAEKVVGILQKSGARFLKKDKVGWIQVTDPSLIREKVSHGFRNRRLGKKQPTSSSKSTSKSSSSSSKIKKSRPQNNNNKVSILSRPYSFSPISTSTDFKRQRLQS